MNGLNNPLSDPDRLAELRNLHLIPSEQEAAYDRLARLASRILEAPVSLFSLVDDRQQFFKAMHGLNGWAAEKRGTPLSHSFCQHVVKTGQRLVVNNAPEHPLVKDNLAIAELGVVAYAGIPICSPDGHVLGSFCVIDSKPREWSDQELETLQELADMVMTEVKLRCENMKRKRVEADLGLVMDFAGAAIIRTNAKGEIQAWNPRAEKMFGWKADEVVGRHNLGLICPNEERDELCNFFKKHAQPDQGDISWLREQKGEKEIKLSRKNGSQFGALVNLGAIIEPKTGLSGVVLVINDLTDHLREVAIRSEMAERIKKISCEVPGMIYQYRQNPDGTSCFPYTSDGILTIYGLSPEAVREDASEVFKVLHPDDYDHVVKTIQQSARTMQAWRCEYRVRFQDGTVRWLNGHSMPEKEPDGSILWHGYITDITDRRLMENALRKTEALLRTFVEHSPAAVAMFDREMRYLIASRQWYEDYKLHGRDIIGRTHYEVFPEIPDRWKDDHQRCLRGEVYRNDADLFEREDGSEQWLSYEIRPWHQDDGEIGGIVMFTRDISAQKQAEKEMDMLERKLMETQKLESLGVLAGGIAHDFNNILTVIIGNNSLALEVLGKTSPVRDYLESVQKSAQRAADLIKQMLAYSGRGRFVIQPLDMSSVVEETTQLIEISISKNAVLRQNLAQGLPSVEADVAQIRQIIMNLVINASEAVGQRSGVISVCTGLAHADRSYLDNTLLGAGLPEGEYVFLEVADNGTGIAPDQMGRIFDPFFTTKFTGRGLGLAAVLGITRGHKGTLKVYSEVGKGTTFKLLLPCVPHPAMAISDTVAQNISWKGTGTILVVDDEETVRATAARMLRFHGFTVEFAADGQEGVQKYRDAGSQYRLVLLDLTMPHLDGAQAFSEIRRINPAARVLLMSGFSEMEATSRFAGKGLAGFVQKPFEMASLITALRGALADQDET